MTQLRYTVGAAVLAFLLGCATTGTDARWTTPRTWESVELKIQPPPCESGQLGAFVLGGDGSDSLGFEVLPSGAVSFFVDDYAFDSLDLEFLLGEVQPGSLVTSKKIDRMLETRDALRAWHAAGGAR